MSTSDPRPPRRGVRDKSKFLRIESKCQGCEFESFDTCNDHGSRFFSRISNHVEATGHVVDVKTYSELAIVRIETEEDDYPIATFDYAELRRRRRYKAIVVVVVILCFGVVLGQAVQYLVSMLKG